jgi:hypothetical protein
MSSDKVRARHRLSEIRDTSVALQTIRRRLRQERETKLRDIEALTGRLDALGKVAELFRALMDMLVMSHVRSIEGVVTEGLRSVFDDQVFAFEAEVQQRYNKLAIDFYFRQDHKRVSVRAHPLEAFGGGPSSVASLILKVLAMKRLGKWPLLVLDETLAAVSDEYIDQTGAFLKGLAAKTGFSILLVTHKAGFLEHADIAYRASEHGNSETGPRVALQRLGKP